jgi:hypothetical protein
MLAQSSHPAINSPVSTVVAGAPQEVYKEMSRRGVFASVAPGRKRFPFQSDSARCSYWARGITQPVDFAGVISNMLRETHVEEPGRGVAA